MPRSTSLRTDELGPTALESGLAYSRGRARGQMLVLFVMSIFVLTGITAVVVDISWYLANIVP